MVKKRFPKSKIKMLNRGTTNYLHDSNIYRDVNHKKWEIESF